MREGEFHVRIERARRRQRVRELLMRVRVSVDWSKGGRVLVFCGREETAEGPARVGVKWERALGRAEQHDTAEVKTYGSTQRW